MLLPEICDIIYGLTPRGRIERTAIGGRPVITLRDISNDGHIDPEALMRSDLPNAVERYLVGPGDVVFRSRGPRNTATVIDERLTEPAVAILPLLVLRPNPKIVTADYLAWAINGPAAQRHFDRHARGASMRMIPRSALATLELDVPDLATQKRIVAVDRLADRECFLAMRVADIRRQMMTLALADRAASVRSLAP